MLAQGEGVAISCDASVNGSKHESVDPLLGNEYKNKQRQSVRFSAWKVIYNWSGSHFAVVLTSTLNNTWCCFRLEFLLNSLLCPSRDAADLVVQGKGKFEELMVCSHEIAASTAQLVAASKVSNEPIMAINSHRLIICSLKITSIFIYLLS